MVGPLAPEDYQLLLDTEAWLGAIVNQNNTHWVAIVKHVGVLWQVNSVATHRTILDHELFGDLVRPRRVSRTATRVLSRAE